MMLPYDCFVGARGAAAGYCPTSEQDCLVGRRDLWDSSWNGAGFRSGFRLDNLDDIRSITYFHIDDNWAIDISCELSITFWYCFGDVNKLDEMDFGGEYYLLGVSVGGVYKDIIGNAFLIMDRNHNVVGFHDTYDFDMETKRNPFAQFVTGYVHFFSYLNPFVSSYTIYYFNPSVLP